MYVGVASNDSSLGEHRDIQLDTEIFSNINAPA